MDKTTNKEIVNFIKIQNKPLTVFLEGGQILEGIYFKGCKNGIISFLDFSDRVIMLDATSVIGFKEG